MALGRQLDSGQLDKWTRDSWDSGAPGSGLRLSIAALGVAQHLDELGVAPLASVRVRQTSGSLQQTLLQSRDLDTHHTQDLSNTPEAL